MPQMSPLSWWMLFIYFIIIMLMFNMMNYYIIMYNSPLSKFTKFSFKSLNWKW
uniref:ATP synthase complex subunit 8 n=1 Tax=Eumantispa harmandi TaxID=1593348 RepID=A0A1S5QYE7_9NEOP|nr:ATP synthase F0 subunit 8 [Eumantispa harmandi]AMW67933.1 ATP synthase F0 subunit 8 [Eumantispa harmandi]AYG51261.1 ATP synthase F0 subunit 8 [Eumantispa harmandi]